MKALAVPAPAPSPAERGSVLLTELGSRAHQPGQQPAPPSTGTCRHALIAVKVGRYRGIPGKKGGRVASSGTGRR